MLPHVLRHEPRHVGDQNYFQEHSNRTIDLRSVANQLQDLAKIGDHSERVIATDRVQAENHHFLKDAELLRCRQARSRSIRTYPLVHSSVAYVGQPVTSHHPLRLSRFQVTCCPSMGRSSWRCYSAPCWNTYRRFLSIRIVERESRKPLRGISDGETSRIGIAQLMETA